MATSGDLDLATSGDFLMATVEFEVAVPRLMPAFW